MSFSPFKEVSTANPGSATRYGSDDLLEIMKIFNAKIVPTRRPEIVNPWRWSAALEFKQVSNPTAPTDANVIILYNDAADNKLKVKKSGGTVVNIEDLGSGAWDNDAAETILNKTVPIESNFIKHGTTNFVGDILVYDGTRYNRKAKGAANQVLAVNAAATDLEWQTPAGGGGGGGEANSGENIGTAGIGLFAQKLALNLQFKKIFSPTGTVLITDNVANERIDLDLGAGVVSINQANTYGDFLQAFRSSRLSVSNPAGTFAYFFVGSAITASRNLILPLLTANDTVAVLNLAQTLAAKTLTSATIDTDANSIKHSTTNSLGELMINTGTKFDRRAKGTAGTYLKVNAAGTDLEWGTVPSVGNLDALSDVTITSPAIKQTLRYTGTTWINTLLLLDDLSDVVITSPANKQFLRFDGSSWVNALGFLDDLSDVVITTPAIDHVLKYTGTQWVNAAVPSGRESLEAVLGPAGESNIGSSYVDAKNIYTDLEGDTYTTGTKAITSIDFTGKTQYKVQVSVMTEGSGSPDIRLVNDADTGQVLHEFVDASPNSTPTSVLTTLPAWCIGVKTLRLQVGGVDSSTDIGVNCTKVFLK
jgi:hypothetical protein